MNTQVLQTPIPCHCGPCNRISTSRMANLNFQYSSAPLRSIQEIQFGLLSPEEIKNMSVAPIEYPETMDEQNLRPRQMGLADPRLGSIDRAVKCGTCDENMSECPGHFGHIELAVPVYHVGMLSRVVYAQGSIKQTPGFMTKIKKLLETVCHNCGKILVDEVSRPLRDGGSHSAYVADVFCSRAIQRLRMLYVVETPRNGSTWSGGFANLR